MWLCTGGVEAAFEVRPPVPGKPVDIDCIHFAPELERYFYSNHGAVVPLSPPVGKVIAERWDDDAACNEVCTMPVADWKEAIFSQPWGNYETIMLWDTYDCNAGGEA